MKRRAYLALLALCLAFSGLVSLGSAPASAHNASTTSYFYCGAWRVDSGDLVIHSKPRYIDANVVIYYCKEQGPGGTWSYNVWVATDGSSSTGTHYQDCSLACESEP